MFTLDATKNTKECLTIDITNKIFVENYILFVFGCLGNLGNLVTGDNCFCKETLQNLKSVARVKRQEYTQERTKHPRQ